MTGSEDIGNGMKVGFNWEWQNSQNPSGAGPSARTSTSVTGKTMRKAEVWFSGGWGKLSLGQGDGAGNGTTEVDLSDTWNVAYTWFAPPSVAPVRSGAPSGGGIGTGWSDPRRDLQTISTPSVVMTGFATIRRLWVP